MPEMKLTAVGIARIRRGDGSIPKKKNVTNLIDKVNITAASPAKTPISIVIKMNTWLSRSLSRCAKL
jgi:hypothetical protein